MRINLPGRPVFVLRLVDQRYFGLRLGAEGIGRVHLLLRCRWKKKKNNQQSDRKFKEKSFVDEIGDITLKTFKTSDGDSPLKQSFLLLLQTRQEQTNMMRLRASRLAAVIAEVTGIGAEENISKLG